MNIFLQENIYHFSLQQHMITPNSVCQAVMAHLTAFFLILKLIFVIRTRQAVTFKGESRTLIWFRETCNQYGPSYLIKF